MRQIEQRLIVALVLLVTLSGCAMTSVRQHPDFASGKRKIDVVALLPSEVEYRHLVFTGENERDAEREKSIAADIEHGMGVELKAHGYTSKSDVLDKARSGDKEFNFQLEQLKGAYTRVAKELYEQPMVQVEQSSKFKVGVGPLANPFAAISGADALLFARYQGFDKSEGLIAKEVLASALLAALTGSYYIPVKSGGQIELSLIDGVTGDILWSNAAGGPLGAYASLVNAMTKLPAKASAGSVPAAEPSTAAAALAQKVESAQALTPAAKTEAASQPAKTDKTL